MQSKIIQHKKKNINSHEQTIKRRQCRDIIDIRNGNNFKVAASEVRTHSNQKNRHLRPKEIEDIKIQIFLKLRDTCTNLKALGTVPTQN